MRDDLKPAFVALQGRLAEFERRVAETKRAINQLCDAADMPPLYTNVDTESRPTVASLRADQFYGKVLTTAAREYLEMRQAANLGPASPREIYEALIQGGFKFDTTVEINAINGLRQVMRKNSSIFHRLPQGTYGLLAWYPNAKATRPDEEEDAESRSATTRTAKPRAAKAPKGRTAKPEKSARPRKQAKPESAGQIADFVMEAINEGSGWTLERLKERAVANSIEAPEKGSFGRMLHGALLNLSKRGLIEKGEDGTWRKAGQKEAGAGANAEPTPAAA
jgi:hypothetical protein